MDTTKRSILLVDVGCIFMILLYWIFYIIGNYYIGSLNIDIGHNQKIILFINNYLSIPINVPNIDVSHD